MARVGGLATVGLVRSEGVGACPCQSVIARDIRREAPPRIDVNLGFGENLQVISRSRTMQLKDGRRLGWAEFGSLQGRPVLYFHGWPGSGAEAVLASGAARRNGVRLIAPDRPGMGLSDFQPQRSILDWPGDVVQLTHHLGLKRFAVMGLSGGAPYALACASEIPRRLNGVSVVSGIGPLDSRPLPAGMGGWNRLLVPMGRRFPRTTRRLFTSAIGFLCRRPKLVLRFLPWAFPGPDAALVRQSDFCEVVRGLLSAIVRTGSQGVAWDGTLYLQPWGFALDEIALPVQLWHGVLDQHVPIAVGKSLRDQLPQCQVRFLREGHLSLWYRNADAILRGLMAQEAVV